MRSFSMWEMTGIEDLNHLITLIRDRDQVIKEIDWDDVPLTARINEIDGFDINNPEAVEINAQNINYVLVDCNTERAKRPESWYNNQRDLRPREERTNNYQSRALFFEHNNSVKCVMFTGSSRARTIINDCFPEEHWGGVVPAVIAVTEDLLYWIFKKFIDLRGAPLSPNHALYVTALKSFTGRTRDNVNAMRGNGNRISTILGTLAFLFNNENLKAVRPQLQYNGEVNLIEISLTGTCRIWEEEYQGGWLFLDQDRLVNNIVIYTYIVLLPTLVDCYRDNIARGVWSQQLKIEFLQRLGNEIKDQVEAELDRLQNEAVPEDEDLEVDVIEAIDLFDVSEEEDEEG